MVGENLVGMRGGDGFFDGYNPFALYGAAERGRGKPLPPHLVFAELDQENPDDACAFLNAYGPLQGTNFFLPLSAHEHKKWKKLESKSPSPERHFRSTLGQVPLLPDPPTPQDHFYSCPLASFWKAQSEFELALRLHSALDSRPDQLAGKANPLAPHAKIQLILATKKQQWKIQGRNIERQYINRARDFVATTVNKHLEVMSPRIARVPNSTAVTAVWGRYTLLQAMYLMLFLDIAGWTGRITQCEKCHSLFYTVLKRTKYCSTKCENRDRALRAYYKKKGGS